MPRVWAEAYRGEGGSLRARLFRASWLRPWRATHVMELLCRDPDGHAHVWMEVETGLPLRGVLLTEAYVAARTLRDREASDPLVGAWTPLVPLARASLAPGCATPSLCDVRLGLGWGHRPSCPMSRRLGPGRP